MQWQELSLSVVSRSVTPICREWLFQQSGHPVEPPDIPNRVLPSAGSAQPRLSEGGGNLQKMEKKVLDSMVKIMKNSESIPSYLMRSGKAGLYADLIYFLRFGSVR
jgi:hypothetical protein